MIIGIWMFEVQGVGMGVWAFECLAVLITVRGYSTVGRELAASPAPVFSTRQFGGEPGPRVGSSWMPVLVILRIPSTIARTSCSWPGPSL